MFTPIRVQPVRSCPDAPRKIPNANTVRDDPNRYNIEPVILFPQRD